MDLILILIILIGCGLLFETIKPVVGVLMIGVIKIIFGYFLDSSAPFSNESAHYVLTLFRNAVSYVC